MLSLLDWLKDKVVEAIERINEVRRFITDKITYVTTLAHSLVDVARNYLLSVISNVRAHLDAFIRNISDRVQSVYNALYNYIVSQITYALRWAEEKVLTLRNTAFSLIDNVYNRAIGFINNAVGIVRGYFEARVNDVYRFLNQRFGEVFNFINNAACVINFLRTNPIGFLIALFEHFFLAWVQEEIAYSFGTFKATLPPRENFFKRICN